MVKYIIYDFDNASHSHWDAAKSSGHTHFAAHAIVENKYVHFLFGTLLKANIIIYGYGCDYDHKIESFLSVEVFSNSPETTWNEARDKF